MAAKEPRWRTSSRCESFRSLFSEAEQGDWKSWDEVEAGFLAAMGDFDSRLSATVGATLTDDENTEVSADIQNGKGDFFNDLLALLLLNFTGLDSLATRSMVPGLIVPTHNLDGAFPDDGPIRFLLEAKMMGTPKHINNPKADAFGRPGAQDIKKRITELGFKSIDLKGEHSRRAAASGGDAAAGGPGGGDLTTWLRAIEPKIYFLLGVRVVSDGDMAAVVRWAEVAAQVVDAVGLFCFEPIDESYTEYRKRTDVPTNLQIERVLYKAAIDLRSLND